MPQYKYPVKNGIKWMAKFNYTDSKSGKAKTEYKRGFASKREAKKYEEDFIENLIMPEETEIEPIRTFGEVFQEYLMSHKRADIKESTLETKFNIFNKHIFPTFEEKQVDTITDDDIANWQNEIKSVVQPNGKHFSESYLRTIQSQFNSIINYALNKVHRAVYDRLTEVLEQLKRLNNGNEIDDELLENIKLITNIIEGLYQKK